MSATAHASVSLQPSSARWTYAVGAFALTIGALFAPLSPVAFLGLAGAIGYWLGKRVDCLRGQCTIDPLTGLFNRRHFEESLERELHNGARHGHSTALLLVDVDSLKVINDSVGHAAGDDAIQAVAEALRLTCRSYDLAARWGGDEFVVLAPHTNEAQAAVLAQRISEAVVEVARRESIAAVRAMTVSVGIATAHADVSSSPATLFQRADAAMYTVKGGRSAKVIYLPPTLTALQPQPAKSR